MRLVVPHFRRAVLVARSFELKSTQAATLAGMLDGLTVSIVLVDAHGAIVHANGAGRAMLEAGEVLCTTRGRIAATSLEAQSPLLEALAAASSGDVAVGDSIALPAPEKQTYVARVLPLRSEQRHGNPLAATAALFVHKAVPPVRPPSGAIAKYYKLTPTELRVLLTTVEMGSVADVAKALGIAESTVKTHLGRLYGKTGTSGQVDLVKLVARFSTPLLC